jgi:exodeoxyribonuclease VII large subunit
MPSRKPPEQGSFDFQSPPRALPPPVTTPQRADAPPAKTPDAAPPIPAQASPRLGTSSAPLADELSGPRSPVTPPEPRTYTVSDLVRAAARAVEARFALVWVEGEISNLSAPRSGHLYFTLKDAEAQLPSVMFRSQAERLKFQPHDGLVVRARGKLSIFEQQGKFQLYVDALEPAGLGALQLAFEQLKQKLEREGLFAATRKRALPRWPRRIGVVTSPTGAAVRDILRIAERRGRARFLISPCQVQGETAPFEIIRAIKRVERYVDVIIVARGGGSAEDLAAFNDEALARTIAACRVPVVSAVGHEVDFTIADFVADARAPTPSGAAELVVPSRVEAQQRLGEVTTRLMRAGQRTIADARLRLDGELGKAEQLLRARLAQRRRLVDQQAQKLAGLHPRARLHRDRAALDVLTRKLHAQLEQKIPRARQQLLLLRQRLDQRAQQILDARKRNFAIAAGKLNALSPLAVLSRGYSLTRTAAGHVVTDAREVQPGDDLQIRLARGELEARVQSVRVDDKPGNDKPGNGGRQ